MGFLGAILSSVVLSDVGNVINRLKRYAVFMAIASVFFLTAYVFLLVAAFFALDRHYSPLASALIIAGIAIAIALVLVLIMAGMAAREKRFANERRLRAQLPTKLAITSTLTIFRRKPLVAAGVAMALGALLGFTR